MSIEVIKPGLLTTLQDLGRVGFQRMGVPVAGCMDENAHRIANLLVGNADQATLEITLMGPSLRFDECAVIAISGADLSPRVDDEPVPQDTSLFVAKGARLDFGKRVSGMRAYLAVRGGFAAVPALGSASTYLRGGFGGFEGRALRKGDVLHVTRSDVRDGLARQETRPARPSPVPIPTGLRPSPLEGSNGQPPTVRLIRGQHWDSFTPEARQALLESEFRLSPRSDRMGFRLEGEQLSLLAPLEMASEAVAFGTIQVPPDGQPIVLMADRQTTGGYPKIASVASVDLPILAQLMPGQGMRFTVISLAEAQRLDAVRLQTFADFERLLSYEGTRT